MLLPSLAKISRSPSSFAFTWKIIVLLQNYYVPSRNSADTHKPEKLSCEHIFAKHLHKTFTLTHKTFAFSQETLQSLKSFAKVLCSPPRKMFALKNIVAPRDFTFTRKNAYFLAKVLRSPEKLCVCSQNIWVQLKKDLHSLKKYCIHYLKSKNICVLTKYLHFPLQNFAKENKYFCNKKQNLSG